jgi:hypothetical protein
MDRQPSEFFQFCILPLVPTPVLCQFGFPPVPVAFGEASVIRTCVPEAPVDKDGNLHSAEDDVGGAGQVTSVEPEAEAAAM